MLHQSFGLTNSATLFMSFSLSRKGKDLLVDEIAALHAAIVSTQLTMPFRADAWVILPDGMHCVWTLPKGDMNIGARWRAVRRNFAHAVGPGRVRWRPAGPPRVIAGVVDYAESVRQCWFAPVNAGLVARPEDWAHSSIHTASSMDAHAA